MLHAPFPNLSLDFRLDSTLLRFFGLDESVGNKAAEVLSPPSTPMKSQECASSSMYTFILKSWLALLPLKEISAAGKLS